MYTADTLTQIIQNRKSVYPYQYEAGKKVDDYIVRQILRNAHAAPNHKKTYPWRFTVFTGEGLQQFADLQEALYRKYKGNEHKIKLQKLADYPLMASHVIAIGMKRTTNKLPEIEEVLAVGCAIENMYLTASSYGLGCYLTTGGITYIEEAKSHFNLGAEDKLIGFFYIGVIKQIPPAAGRGDVEDLVQWVRTKQ